MIVDLLIILLLGSAFFRGREIGFVQQLFSTAGFFGGLLFGAWLEPHTVTLAHTPLTRSIVTLITTLGLAFLLLSVGEYGGALLKHKVRWSWLNKLDDGLGAVVSVLSILVAVWLSASIIRSLPYPTVQADIRSSKIVTFLTEHLPAAPDLVAKLGHLVDPNGFPEVFSGSEPNPGTINLPASSQIAAAVEKDRVSVVKVEGQGCGGVVDGSGFVVGNGLVATNAHVVAGIKHSYVQDANGTHSATVVYFNPNLDFAVLRVADLAGAPLTVTNRHNPDNTPAAILGYPGGGNFTADPATVIEQFIATGRNIYGQGNTERSVYEIAGTVIPGNSGGPLVATDGSVIGVVFAESTSYNNVGYALTTTPVISAIQHAGSSTQAVSTGSCAQ